MARPRDISPCEKRERVHGRRRRYSGCECAHAFKCAASKPSQPEWIAYGLDEAGRTIRLENEAKLPAGTLLAVPCNETFLDRRSPGTRLHTRALGDGSKFKGCFDVERFLLTNELVRYEARERLGRELDPTETSELFGSISDYGSPTSDDLLGFLLDGARRELNHQEMHQMSLSAFEWQEKLEREQSTATGAPTGPEALAELQELLWVREESAALIERLLAGLTTKQRNAVRAVYLDNFEGLSRARIANRMGIGLDSLNERIAGAFKKLRGMGF